MQNETEPLRVTPKEKKNNLKFPNKKISLLLHNDIK